MEEIASQGGLGITRHVMIRRKKALLMAMMSPLNHVFANQNRFRLTF
jgi:hypothetical protein